MIVFLPALLLFLPSHFSAVPLSDQHDSSSVKVTVIGVEGKWEANAAMAGAGGSASGRTFTFGDEFYDQPARISVTCDGGSLVLLKQGEAHSFPCVGLDGTANGCVTSMATGTQQVKCVREISLNFARKPARLRLIAELRLKPFSQFVVPVSRGLQAQLDDAVVPFAGDRVDMAAALKDTDAGNYKLRFESLADRGRSLGPFAIRWAGSAPATAVAAGIKPGLYRLTSFDLEGRKAGGEAWVLLCGAKNYQQNSRVFDAAADATQDWPDNADPRAARVYLRSVLDALSAREAE
jgi:hypothetical protein